MKSLILALAFTLAGLLPIPASAQAASLAAASAASAAAGAAADETVIFLVRHAETEPDGTRDPALSPEGLERAARLADVLRDAGIEALYTTDYGRTRGTAGAVADRLGLKARVYNPSRLGTFAEALTTRGGRILVVGHSNTTPQLVAELGGQPGSPIDEAEHDRLYVLFIAGTDDQAATDPAAGVRTVLLRY